MLNFTPWVADSSEATPAPPTSQQFAFHHLSLIALVLGGSSLGYVTESNYGAWEYSHHRLRGIIRV